MAILTSRPVLTTPEAADLLHIVDVSDTPSTSKQITLANVGDLLSNTKVREFIFTSNDNHVPTVGTTAIQIIATAPGGGGGGVDGVGAGTAGAGISGSGGETIWLTILVIDATYAIVVPAGGAGGAAGNNAGTNAAATTVISSTVSISATGGRGGAGELAQGAAYAFTDGEPGGAPGIGGDDNELGGGSGPSIVALIAGAGVLVSVSTPGCSYWGCGGNITLNANGQNGLASGSGGAGAANSDTATNFSGGNGQRGKVIIREYS